MDKRNWQILYTSYSSMAKKAVELVYKEMGALLLRDKGRYTIHVLRCEKEENANPDQNTVVIGLYDSSALIQKYIGRAEIKAGGYLVKVMDDPECKARKLVLITANEPAALFYGAVDFVDDYFAFAAPVHGSVRLVDEIFDNPLPDYHRSSAPAIKTRSVFTWGHPINDYRGYIENMARLKLNQLIIWNDYVPINGADIVAYAHEFGIQVIWGFAWGWSRNCADAPLDSLDDLADSIITTYETQYKDTGADGIYFQSFTELDTDKIGNKLIAEAVTDLVNLVSGRLLDKYPKLHIQFGLHATSVKDHLGFIAKVDSRVEIMWEDCGAFPYGYDPFAKEKGEFEKALDFTDRILALRQEGGVSMLFKGFMTLDWVGDRFVHQAGPFILGMSDEKLIRHDREMLAPIWRQYQSAWLQNGEYAYKMAKHISQYGNQNVTVGMAGQFAGGIWLPEALCAQILWENDSSYATVFDKVTRRRVVDIV